MNSKAMVRRINPNAFFGFEYLNYSGLFVPVSTPEKILLDLVYCELDVDDNTCRSLAKASSSGILNK